MRGIAAFVCLFLALPGTVSAQTQPEQPAAAQTQVDLQERLKLLEERIRSLEAEVQSLKAAQAAEPTSTGTAAPAQAVQPAAAQVPVAYAQGSSAQLPVYGGASTAAKVLNPDISVIGDFLGTVGKNPAHGVPTLELHEAEVGFQAIVDPYARGDFFISFGEQGVELEEGYLTFTSLPGGLVAKVGKMRASFGKVNTLHNHTLPWIDRPMVTENLVNGEDGISDAGLSLSRILPAPKGIFLEATGQVFRGDSGDLFHASEKKDVSFVGYLRGYRDLSDSTNLDVGLSYARGHNALGSNFVTELYGLDTTLRWKPLRRAIYHSLLARAELIWSRRDQLASLQRAFGFYTSADYRLNRRWTVGGRYDRSNRSSDTRLTDSGFSAVLTYWPSEFSQIRGQYRFARYAEGRDGNELRFQFLFSLGAHGAHPF